MEHVDLPGRLRELAEHFADAAPVDAVPFREVRAALAGAADELERLASAAHVPRATAEARQTYLGETLEDFVAPSGHVFAAIVLPNREALRLCGGEPAPGVGAELDALGRELAGDAGVAAPMPRPRRFAARYADPGTGQAFPTPAPGSFVFAGPALAVWRVLGVTELDGDTRGSHVLELEAVDPHDVPTLSRIDTVPLPVTELAPDAEGAES